MKRKPAIHIEFESTTVLQHKVAIIKKYNGDVNTFKAAVRAAITYSYKKLLEDLDRCIKKLGTEHITVHKCRQAVALLSNVNVCLVPAGTMYILLLTCSNGLQIQLNPEEPLSRTLYNSMKTLC